MIDHQTAEPTAQPNGPAVGDRLPAFRSKVDVGRFDRNLDISSVYGEPTKKGIPAAVVLSPGNDILYATRAGELSNARRMSDTGVHDFFQNAVATAAKAKP